MIKVICIIILTRIIKQIVVKIAKEGESKMLMEKEKFKKQKEQKISRRNSKREQERKNNFVSNKGITLIALVVTIIVLVVLARSKY